MTGVSGLHSVPIYRSALHLRPGLRGIREREQLFGKEGQGPLRRMELKEFERGPTEPRMFVEYAKPR